MSMDGRGVVVDFDTIFSVWFKMEPSQKKEKLGLSLRASPLFEQLSRKHEIIASESKRSGAVARSQLQNFNQEARLGKNENMEERKTKEISSAANGEGQGLPKCHLAINADGIGNTINQTLSASTGIQISNTVASEPHCLNLTGLSPNPPLEVNQNPNEIQRSNSNPNDLLNTSDWAEEPLTQMSAAQISPYKNKPKAGQPTILIKGKGPTLLTEEGYVALPIPQLNQVTAGPNSGETSNLFSELGAATDREAQRGNREVELVEGPFINYDYTGEPEPEEVLEEESETQLGDREALASYERNGSPMDVDHDEPTIYQSDTESYRGMCSAEFERLLKEVETGGEEAFIAEGVNEGNSRPTDINLIEEERDFEEGTGENENEAEIEVEEAEANIMEDDESPKGPRRSKRISEKGPAKSYATPTKRNKKSTATNGKGACSRAMEGEKELRRALEDEFLNTTPLDAIQTEQADLYCGIRLTEQGRYGEVWGGRKYGNK